MKKYAFLVSVSVLFSLFEIASSDRATRSSLHRSKSEDVPRNNQTENSQISKTSSLPIKNIREKEKKANVYKNPNYVNHEIDGIYRNVPNPNQKDPGSRIMSRITLTSSQELLPKKRLPTINEVEK